MIRRYPLIPFSRLLSYSMMLVAPTVLALDALVFLQDLDVNFAIWVVAGTMISSIVIAWLFLGDMAEMALYVSRSALGDPDDKPDLRSGTAQAVAVAVAQMNRKWRRRIDVFSQSINADMEILETLNDPLIFVDSSQRVVRANAAARELFGRSLAAETIEEALQPAELREAVEQSLDQRRTITFALEWPGIFRRHFDVRVLPLSASEDQSFGDEAGPVPPAIAAVVTLHETTELRRAAELRERFIANVSHELRTPLSSILGFIETIQGPARDDPNSVERFLSIMRDQAERMNRIVADLLSLAHIEERERERPTELVDLAGLLRDVADGLAIRAAQRDMSIDLSIDDDVPAVPGDIDQLFQVFQNLAENAIKYGAGGTQVRIAAFRTDVGITVCVKDSGDGIAPEHIPHLGERFYRVDSARSRATGGSGLGLAIVRRIVSRHGGRLRIESTPGIGSIFHVDLPIELNEDFGYGG